MRPVSKWISTSACSQDFMAARVISAAGPLAFREMHDNFGLAERARQEPAATVSGCRILSDVGEEGKGSPWRRSQE